jgi:hypothetical protein
MGYLCDKYFFDVERGVTTGIRISPGICKISGCFDVNWTWVQADGYQSVSDNCNCGRKEPCPERPCPSGTFNNKTLCNSGGIGRGGGSQCSCNLCPAGKYAGATGATACVDCGAGKYGNATGQTAEASCTACGAGTYSAAVGASASSTCNYSCPSNSNSPAGSTALTSCTCNAGYMGQNGDPCTVCVAGKYQSVTAATVTCSGGCLCQPSSGTSSGTISDGLSGYENNANCTWLIASRGLISLSFSSFDTEWRYDFVTINNCTSSSSCVRDQEIASLSGSSSAYRSQDGKPVSLSTIYTSNTGYMQVVFTSDGSVVSSGFVASWIVLGDMMFDGVPTSTCTDCPTNSNSPAGSAALTNCTCNTGSMGPNHFPCATVICVRLCFSCLYGVM